MNAAAARLLSTRVDLTDPGARAELVAKLQRAEQAERNATIAKARQLNLPLVTPDGAVLAGFEGNTPIYDRDENVNAAISVATNLVRDTSPYNVDGTGYIIGLWEAGGIPRVTHNELQGRATVNDGYTTVSSHATHVAGTLIAAGLNSSVEGMAPGATILAHSSGSAISEMTALAAAAPNVPGTIYVSNHSYGTITGWATNPRRFYGTFSNDGDPSNDYPNRFGRYTSTTASWDGLAWNAPYFLMFKSGGNDRNDNHPSNGTVWRHNSSSGTQYTYDSASHPLADFEYLVDGGVNGFGTVGQRSSCKNMFVIGSVLDAVTGGVRDVDDANLNSFSSAGPTDDGRIKPDVVANGNSLLSLDDDSNTDTTTKSGTSMSSPSACGSALLLQDYYDDRFPGQAMLSSMLKGLMIHTTDDRGNPGPDYRFGWGLLNIQRAAALIKDHADTPTTRRMYEQQLNATTASRNEPLIWNGIDPIRVTLSWTDPPGSSTGTHDNRIPRLVHDLNLKLTSPDGATQFLPYVMPWVGVWTNNLLNDNATTGVNNVDNVEQVYLASPAAAGAYTITIDHANSLSEGPQDYALIVSGGSIPTLFAHWAALNFPIDFANPAIAGFESDPEEDRLVNGLEYAFDLPGDISNTSEGDIYTLGSETIGLDSYLTLTYDRDNSKTDITYHVEWTTDLLTWNIATSSIEATNDDIDTMKASFLLSGGPLFARIVITQL